jgi:hypothetical protein
LCLPSLLFLSLLFLSSRSLSLSLLTYIRALFYNSVSPKWRKAKVCLGVCSLARFPRPRSEHGDTLAFSSTNSAAVYSEGF